MNKKFTPLIVLAVILAIGYLGNNITGNTLKDEELVIYFPTTADFPNNEQGKMTVEFNFPDAIFNVGDQKADLLMFLDSKMVPGLKISYNQNDKKIYAGLPPLVAEVVLMDGKGHKLVYAFHREQRKQFLLLDDKQIAEGEFTGGTAAGITGLSIFEQPKFIESSFPITISFE